MIFPAFTHSEKLRFIDYFSEHLTPNKLALFDKAIAERTRHVVAVVENVYAEQNASAILRTVECLGLQDFFVIEEYNKFKVPKKIASGAAKWVNMHRYNKQEHNARYIVDDLKAKGYKIVCTSPALQTLTPYNIDINDKLAVFFGEEEPGLSLEMMQLADAHMHIPMYGFTESLNVSVSAGIILSTLVQRLKTSDLAWQLSLEEQADLKLSWMCGAIKGGAEMLSRLK